MAPAKTLIYTGAAVIVAAVVAAVPLLAGHIGPAAELLLRIDILAVIAGAGLAVTGLVLSDLQNIGKGE